MSRPAVVGIVLAGGQGFRLGLGRPKALAEMGGTTLLERAIAILAGVADEVLAVAPASMALPIPRASRVDDPPGAAGPLAALVAGLAARPGIPAVALGVDFPLARSSMLRALLEALPGASAVVPAPGGIPQPLAAAYAPAALAMLSEWLRAGERALVPVVRRLEPRWVMDDGIERFEGGLDNFLNVNTPADFERAAALLAPRPPVARS